MSSLVRSFLTLKTKYPLRGDRVLPIGALGWIVTDEYLQNHFPKEYHKDILDDRKQEELKGNLYVHFKDYNVIRSIPTKDIR